MAKFAATVALAVVPAAVLTVAPQTTANADSCSDADTNMPLAMDSGPCADVLAQERRWLTAITQGDRATVESILGPSFKHIDSEGNLLDRAQEVAGIEKVSFTMNPSEQLVDIRGDTAVIHGVNTLIAGGGGNGQGTLHRCVRAAERHLDRAVSAGDDARLTGIANLPRV
jgi:urease alpha subunit